MDSQWFDRLVQASEGATFRRRAALALGAGGLLALLGAAGEDEDALAKDRRRRRKQRHRKRGNAGKRKGKRCKRKTNATLCAGRCGTRKNCGRKVNCGGCSWAGEVCTSQKVCAAQSCAVNADCPAGGICDQGACVQCTVTCDAADHVCDGAALQAAVAAGGTVVVCPGQYVGLYVTPEGAAVTVIGAGMGDDPSVDTILDANNAGRLMRVPDGATARFRRLRFTRGLTLTGSGLGCGTASNVTVEQCAFAGNGDATGFGGGARFDGNAEISDSLFTGNSGLSGGAVYFDGFETWVLTFRRSEIRGNTAVNGAGIYGTLTQLNVLDHTVITENTSSSGSSGGGIDTAVLSVVTISPDSSVANNTPVDCTIYGPLNGTCG
ncbi:MAG: hypothetical protein QM692_21755 [Thermomicrobiales bacterium]